MKLSNKGFSSDRIVNFATSKNLTIKRTMFPHRNIHKYTWTSPDGKTHTQTDHILIDRWRHSSTLDVQSFMAADCDTSHYLVVPKVRARLAVNRAMVTGCKWINWHDLNNARHEASTYFRNKKREYLEDKINELATNSKTRNIRDLCRGINEFKRGYQPRNSLVKSENGDLPAVSHSILKDRKTTFLSYWMCIVRC
jgi:hypothetical protein